MRSSATFRLASTCTSSWTTHGATRRRRSATGSPAPPLASALHADVVVLDQPGRALLRLAGRKADQARRPHVGQGADRGHRGVHLSAERLPTAAALDQVRRRHPGLNRPLLPPHPGGPRSERIGTSESGHWVFVTTPALDIPNAWRAA